MSILWFDGVTLTVEIALATNAGPYALFDSGRFDIDDFGPDNVWADVSEHVREISTDRAFSREVQAWDPGTASIVLGNSHRRFSPSNLSASSPYVIGGVSQIQPLRPIRWRATYAGVTYDGYFGDVMDWLEGFSPAYADAVVTLPCEDEMSALSAFDGAEQAAAGAGESSGQRVHRILDNAGSTAPRNIELGSITVQATTLASNATTELKLVTDSEGGGLFIDADGSICFEQQFALIENERSNTVQATFSDGSDGELPCMDIVPSNSGDLVKNIASFARVGGTAQVVDDSASRGKYRDRRETRTDLVCETDVQALALAEFHVARYKDPEYRIKRIVVNPRDDPARLYPAVLGLRPRDLVRVIARPSNDETITRDCHVAGIHHVIDGDNWITTLDLWSATVYTQYSTSRFDLGLFDTATFFFGSGG